MNYLLLNFGQQLINMTSAFITLFVEYFPQSLKILRMRFINKNVHIKRDEEKVPLKQNPGFMKVGSLLGRRIFFSYKQILIFQ